MLKNSDIETALGDARHRFVERRPNTVAQHQAAVRVMPGGNTRTVLYHGPVPICIAKGDGAYLVDVDGHRYLNLLGEYTAGIYGASHPVIANAIRKALRDGVNLSAHNTFEAQLASLVCARFPSIELVRFTNSGTEANLMAISTARAQSGRQKVMVMEGGYHGGLLYFAHGGIPINAPFPYVIGQFNDVETTRRRIWENAASLACIIVEPMLGSGGCIPADLEFLKMLRQEASKTGAVLIFDEVMTSRFPGGGAQGLYGVMPDMTTLGKYIGGGMTAGAFGGRRDLMEMYDPRTTGSMPHAGTFNNNTITMAAGVAGLSRVFTEDAARELHARGETLRTRLNTVFDKAGAVFQATGIGSIIGIHATRRPVRQPDDLTSTDDRLKELLFLDLVDAGFYMARRGFVALSLAVSARELGNFETALAECLEARSSIYTRS